MVPMHMGALHPFEQVLTLLLAFGPFVVLGLVIWRRRREDAEPAEGPAPAGDSALAGDSDTPGGPGLPNSTQPEPPEDLRTGR